MPRRSIKDWSPGETPVKVIFRKHPEDDEIVAVFPEIPGTNEPEICTIYAHVGQHSSAHCRVLMRSTRPAHPEEYSALMQELEAIGYWLDVRQRLTPAMRRTRIAELKRYS